MSVTVNYKGSTLTTISNGSTKTLNTSGKYMEDNVQIVDTMVNGSAFPPAVTITKNPTISLTASTGVITATYAGSSSITPTVNAGYISKGTAGVISTAGTSTYQLTMRSAANMTVSAQSVTAPAGYYSTAFTKAVATTTHPQPTVAIASSTGVVTATHTQGTGYVTSGTTTKTLNLTTQAAQTINTSVADQTIASNRWLTGIQTIKGVTTQNLTADNIKSGTVVRVGDSGNASRITQVTGTYAPNLASIGTSFITRKVMSYSNDEIYEVGKYAFAACTNLSAVSIPKLISIADSAFYSCPILQSISFPFATPVNIYAFYGCKQLTEAFFPFATSVYSYAFSYCSHLKSVRFDNLDMIYDGGFAYCSHLTSFISPVGNIGRYAFQSCFSLSFVLCYHSINTNIKSYAFSQCSNLHSLYLLGSECGALSSINAFTGVASDFKIYVPASIYSTYKTSTNWSNFSSQIQSLTDTQITTLKNSYCYPPYCDGYNFDMEKGTGAIYGISSYLSRFDINKTVKAQFIYGDPYQGRLSNFTGVYNFEFSLSTTPIIINCNTFKSNLSGILTINYSQLTISISSLKDSLGYYNAYRLKMYQEL